MPHADLHTKALLIVIAVLLVLNTLCQLRGPAVHAQSNMRRKAAHSKQANASARIIATNGPFFPLPL
jgi:cell division protein ZapA (FtsZ GTPase activity inhibitor)